MRLVGLAVVLTLVVAGCSDASDDPEGSDGATPGEGSAPPAESGSGSMVGIVVDDAVRPLAGANVTATGASGTLTAVTDAEGGFRFDDLAAGVYLVDVTKPFYIAHRQAVTVVEGVEPETTRFQLTFEASQLPYANVYKLDGFYECGVYAFIVIRLCSNVNIATTVVVCHETGGQVCVGNVTQDRSLFFQWVEPGLDFLQTEMAWTPTSPTGQAMGLLIGGGTEQELQEGVGLPAYNGTSGLSPLMLRVSNHEGPDAWCFQNDQCETSQVVNESRIGTDRALLVQVDPGPSQEFADDCSAPGFNPDKCAVGANAQQPYTLFTITFYGYEPPIDWLFSTSGELPPPPL